MVWQFFEVGEHVQILCKPEGMYTYILLGQVIEGREEPGGPRQAWIPRIF